MDSLLSVFVLKRIHILCQSKDKNNTSDITDITHSHSLVSLDLDAEILGTTVLVYPV